MQQHCRKKKKHREKKTKKKTSLSHPQSELPAMTTRLPRLPQQFSDGVMSDDLAQRRSSSALTAEQTTRTCTGTRTHE